MSRGPDRAEHRLRLAVSLAGLALLGAAATIRDIDGAAWIEIVGVAGAFFGGSAVWSARRLWQGRTD